MIDELFVSFLNSESAIANLTTEIAVGETPETNDEGKPIVATYIWLSSFDEEDTLDLDGESGITRYRFDVECCSLDDRIAKRLARKVKKALQGYGPAEFGKVTTEAGDVAGFVDAVFIDSKDENYISVNQFTSEDLTVIAFDVTIVADDIQDDLESI